MVTLVETRHRLTADDAESMDVGTLAMLGMLRRDVRRSSAAPLIYGRRGVYAVVVPDAMDVQAYAVDSAVHLLLMLSRVGRVPDFKVIGVDNGGWTSEFDSRRGSGALRALQRLQTRFRRIIFVGKLDDFSNLHVDVRAMMDGDVTMSERPHIEHLRGAMISVFGAVVTSADVVEAYRGDVELWSACMAQRTYLRDALTRMIAVLDAREHEAAREILKTATAAVPTVDLSETPTLDEMHGLGEAGEWARQLIEDLAAYGRGELPWSEIDRGALLSGPPGSGKTTFARSLAKSAGVRLIATSVTNWMSPAKGDGSFGPCVREMKRSFSDAAKSAPCVLFIDEIDAIGTRGETDKNSRWMHDFCNALLECVDGFEQRVGVVVVGATNYPDDVDPALRRSGRLDRHIRIPLPDAEARVAIMRWYLRGVADDLDLSPLVNRTNGLSGADLEKACRGARRRARRDGNRAVTIDDIAAELPAVRPVSAAASRIYAVHEAGHAVVAQLLGGAEIVDVSIVRELLVDVEAQPGGGLSRADYQPGNLSREQLIDEITVLLGGIAAEEVVLGRRYTGSGGHPQSDLARATSIAAGLHGTHGLGRQLTLVGLLSDDAQLMLRHPDVRRAVEETLQGCLARARNLVTEHRDAIDDIAERLVEHGRVSGSEIAEIVDRQLRLRLITH
ncbi:AAA family ATPase [Pleomorphomonas carboxyditropha]|uniref:AAA+ ATPase domain-containing protein n=1 Tax=Pleomorphomonas carboxyditropha TaxID=2023338 RepID=A0A2G9X135_9HYPH|nr:AAA family ATPase [Pleomorphomonas carboxyditropha]PIP00656.1 hypothetical protein CJ014_00705 [Pleomorphomonas carboxyditropha]